MLVLLDDLDLAVLVQLGQLHLVQVDPGVALRLGVHPVARVQPQIFLRLNGLFPVGDAYRPLRLSQVHGGCGGLSPAGGAAQQDARRQQQGQPPPVQIFSHNPISF